MMTSARLENMRASAAADDKQIMAEFKITDSIVRRLTPKQKEILLAAVSPWATELPKLKKYIVSLAVEKATMGDEPEVRYAPATDAQKHAAAASACKIPLRYRDVKIENFSNFSKNSIKIISEYLNEPEKKPSSPTNNGKFQKSTCSMSLSERPIHIDIQKQLPPSLIIAGTVGSGKTSLACAILMHFHKKGLKSMYCIQSDVFTRMRTFISCGDAIGKNDYIQSLIDCDLLVIDEIGVQFDTDFEKLAINDLINARYNVRHPTILVSNLPPTADANTPSIESAIGERAFDRMCEHGRLIVLAGESFRRPTNHVY